MRNCFILFLSFCLVFTSCHPDRQSTTPRSILHDLTGDAYDGTPGVLKNYEEVEGALATLAGVTDRWLQCRDPLAEDCEELSWDMADLTEEEAKRLWLNNLLDARERIKGLEGHVRNGVHINKISNDIKSLQKDLEDSIQRLNLSYFKRRIDPIDPFRKQYRWILSNAFTTRIGRLENKAQRGQEIRTQITLLGTMNPGFIQDDDQVRHLIATHLSLSGYTFIRDNRDDEGSRQVLGTYFDDMKDHFRQKLTDMYARHVSPVDIPAEPQQLAAALAGKELSEQEERELELWRKLSRVNSTTMVEMFVEIFASIELPEEEDPGIETIHAAFMSVLNQKQEEVKQTSARDAFPELVVLGAGTIAGQVSFGLTAFFGFEGRGILRSVVLATAIGLYSTKDWQAAFATPGAVLGSLTGMAFALTNLEGLITLAGNHEALKKMIELAVAKVRPLLTSIQGYLAQGVPVVSSWLGKLMGMAKSAGAAIGTTLVKLGGTTLQTLSGWLSQVGTIGNIGMILASITEIYNLAVSWQDLSNMKQALSIATTAVVVSLTVFGMVAAFGMISTPVVNIVFAIGTIAWLVTGLLRAYLPEGEILPDADHPDVVYYRDGIHPTESYYQPCNESDPGENCSKNVQADILMGRNFFKERVLRSNLWGGGGGSNIRRCHFVTGSGELPAQSVAYHSIDSLTLWNCSGEEAEYIGMEYTTRRGATCSMEGSGPELCDKQKTRHIGCGTRPGHRTNPKTFTFDPAKGERITEVTLMQTAEGVRTRRVVGIEVCASTGDCIATDQNPGVNYHHTVIFSDFTGYGRGKNRREGRGEIVGFLSNYGNTIDSLGVYLRMPAETVYDHDLYDEAEDLWTHRWLPNQVCVQMIPREQSLEENGPQLAPNQPESPALPGRCPCEVYVSDKTSTSPAYSRIAQCRRCGPGSGEETGCIEKEALPDNVPRAGRTGSRTGPG